MGAGLVNKIEISRTLRGSFVLSQVTVANLYRHLAEATRHVVSVTVRFVNARTITTDDLAAILADSSVASHKIEVLRLTAGAFSDGNRATITLGYSKSSPVTIEIVGDRALVIALEDSIINELSGVKSSLWFVNSYQWASADTHIAFSIISIFLWVPLVALYFWGEWITVNIPFSFVIISSIFLSLTGVLGPYISPGIVFDFGRGAAINRRRKSLLNFIFMVVGVGLVMGLAVNFLSSRVLPSG